MTVRCAVGLPNVGEFGDPATLVGLAVEAEEAGWDGVFLWDHVLFHDQSWPVANPVVTLAAIAARTARVRLGILVTALPRRRVQTVARESASLDALSGGRLVFGAGLGSLDEEYSAFGEDPDLRGRAARLDESLTALDRLWSGEPVTMHGRFVTVDGVRMAPASVQRPRIPIWCAGRWPTRAGFRRAARWDGAMPTFAGFGRERPVPVGSLAEVAEFLRAERGSLDGFELAVEGRTDEAGGAEVVAGYAAVGLTWWVEAMGWWRGGVAGARARIAAGPPRVG
jgi:alkanesulfonate monooxygenase SsuD/methylene tetrahydromethanopterin reductase-like flavin-dependent oxidoreductase (luciferase family)